MELARPSKPPALGEFVATSPSSAHGSVRAPAHQCVQQPLAQSGLPKPRGLLPSLCSGSSPAAALLDPTLGFPVESCPAPVTSLLCLSPINTSKAITLHWAHLQSPSLCPFLSQSTQSTDTRASLCKCTLPPAWLKYFALLKSAILVPGASL